MFNVYKTIKMDAMANNDVYLVEIEKKKTFSLETHDRMNY